MRRAQRDLVSIIIGALFGFALFLVVIKARADVLVCTSPTSCTPKATPANSDQVLFCPDRIDNGTPQLNALGKPTCATAYPILYSSAQSWSPILTDSGWYQRSAVPAAPMRALRTVTPTCYMPLWRLDLYYQDLEVVRGEAYGWWFCSTPRALNLYWRVGALKNWQKPPDTCDTSCTKSLDDDVFRWRPTDDQIAFFESLDPTARIIAVVAKSGTAKNRQVYAATATFTRGAVIATVPVGASVCRIDDRLVDDTGKGTSYFYVGDFAGQRGYAECTISGRIIQ